MRPWRLFAVIVLSSLIERPQDRESQLSITDEKINRYRAKHRDAVKNDPDFNKLTEQRATAYRVQLAYLFTNDAKLAHLLRQLEEGK
jgi:hypothetical protein